jgi:hypothetical protein
VRTRLQTNFEVDVERTSVILHVGRARIEAALDEGRIKPPTGLNRRLNLFKSGPFGLLKYMTVSFILFHREI